MWCSTCQQDVPAIGSPNETVVCARCQSPLGTGDDRKPKQAVEPISERPTSDPPPLENWELDDDLHAARHRIGLLGLDGINSETPDSTAVRPARSGRARKEKRRRHQASRSSLISWCALALGMMTLVFGGVLLGWSFIMDRADLWRLGMPFTLVGQAVLVIGLVFQLDGLWRNNREAGATLDELDSQLAELRRATSLMSTTHTSPSQSFYVHMAERASPHLMLADLKGQLDLLAVQLSEERH